MAHLRAGRSPRAGALHTHISVTSRDPRFCAQLPGRSGERRPQVQSRPLRSARWAWGGSSAPAPRRGCPASASSATRYDKSSCTVSSLPTSQRGDSSRCSTPAVGRGALEAFDARHYKNRLGIESVRADEPGEVQAALAAKGASVVAWYGVRLFTDHWGPERPGPDFNELLAAEEEAGHPSSATNCILSRVHPFLATGGYNWRCGHQALMSSVEASTGHPRPQRPAEKAASRLAAPGGAVADARRGVGGDGLGPRRGEAPGRCAGRSPT